MRSTIEVASPPVKPLMIYDGDCNFCSLWIHRWQLASGDRFDFLPFQDPQVAARFPEVPRGQFESAVQLIEPDGSVYGGAEAVFRALAHNPHEGWLLDWYDHSPFFAHVTERGYRLVARRRGLFSFLTRLAWGRHIEPPTHNLVRWVFLRSLGLIYLVAFLSLWGQIIGLVGTGGVLPASATMQAIRQGADAQHLGWERYHLVPTLCWFKASDGFLKFQCAAGAALALLLLLDVAPAPCLFLLWLIYLSLATVCREFLSFQWDNLLLETGFLAIFLAPLQLWPRLTCPAPKAASSSKSDREPSRLAARTNMPGDAESQQVRNPLGLLRAGTARGPGNWIQPCAARPSRLVLWLLRWLLFKLMFQSGCVKLLSHDPTWRNLTALTFHYETQPLPTWIGWYAHQLPVWVQKFSTVTMFGIELFVPFLIFAPRRPRQWACSVLVVFQVLIFLTGNYCFFNLLTIALCLLLLDDAAIKAFLPRRLGDSLRPALPQKMGTQWPASLPGASDAPTRPLDPHSTAVPPTALPTRPAVAAPPLNPQPSTLNLWKWPVQVTVPVAALAVVTALMQFSAMFRIRVPWPHPIVATYGWLEPFRSFNSYGLFAVMTTSRPEIIIEGSRDGVNWLAYEFRYKPGDVKRRPGFVEPFQPRLDWQMWFAALGNYRHNPWLVNLCERLLEGSPPVLALFERNPFPRVPPLYIRAVAYDYRFTDLATQRKTGAWWLRREKGMYLRAFSLDEVR